MPAALPGTVRLTGQELPLELHWKVRNITIWRWDTDPSSLSFPQWRRKMGALVVAVLSVLAVDRRTDRSTTSRATCANASRRCWRQRLLCRWSSRVPYKSQACGCALHGASSAAASHSEVEEESSSNDDALPELVDDSSDEGDGDGDGGAWCLEHRHRGAPHAHIVAPCRWGFPRLLVTITADTWYGSLRHRVVRGCAMTPSCV